MTRDRLSITTALGTLIGCLSVAVGAWLRWVVLEPGNTGPVIGVHVPGMETGFELHDYLLLGVTGVGVAASFVLARSRRERLAGAGTAATGVVLSLLTLVLALSLVPPWDPTLDSFVVGPGAYVTMFGALTLTFVGGYQFVAHGGGGRRRSGSETTIG